MNDNNGKKYNNKLRIVGYYIEHIVDELDGAMEYAEMYISNKRTNPSWSKMYSEMANAELTHAKFLINMGDDYISGLSWVPEDDDEAWSKCTAKAYEKIAFIQLMLSK